MVSPNRSLQSSRTLLSSFFRSLNFFGMPLQLRDDDLTSPIVWLIKDEMICLMDLEARSGNEERVETQSSGRSVLSHVEWATWMCFWTWISVVLQWATEEDLRKTGTEKNGIFVLMLCKVEKKKKLLQRSNQREVHVKRET